MRRFFYDEDLIFDETIRLSADESYHLATVLRAKPGLKICLINALGQSAVAECVDVNRKAALVKIESVETQAAVSPAIDLYVAPPKGKLFNQLIKQSVEMGVRHIIPVICEYSENRSTEIPSQCEQTIIEAAKQSGNCHPPKLLAPQAFSEAVKSSIAGIYGSVELSDTATRNTAEEISLWIGPEGGFSEDELSELSTHGIEGVSFGPWILRVETAVVAGLGHLRTRLKK
ncbi:MAG: 16S rRNA (uracil(1498)-N(3))-methyltransferase [Lentisphaeria bacterium]|nr:16S rRNA (uracil(1498)-N(3))-methyltransferase [Lentisphaeria bacterium]NQZ66642.1 16S rRNA (uracil(1498)-N(3))-methyltransferase [Lentisphaeria bacterium]